LQNAKNIDNEMNPTSDHKALTLNPKSQHPMYFFMFFFSFHHLTLQPKRCNVNCYHSTKNCTLHYKHLNPKPLTLL